MKKIVAQCDINQHEIMSIKRLKEMLPEYDVMKGAEALELINSGVVDAKDVFVLQDRNSKIGRKLRKKGAIALVNYCFESEIYARIYYSRLKKIAPQFEYRLYFKGMFDGLNCDKECNIQACYPGISDFNPESINWEDRNFAALVMGNKYVEQNNVLPKPTFKIDKYIKWAFRFLYETNTQKFLRENELQNKRLELIEYFGKKGDLKMFGRGWDNLEELPKSWQKRIENIINKIAPKPLDDKLGTISKYKFNFAVENLSYKGYVTEKILESMVAKTIPVYLGAPDITDYIPKGCFIDIRDFDNLDDLHNYMKNLSSEQAHAYFDCAQKFLESDVAKHYSEPGFDAILAKLVKTYDAEKTNS